MVKSKVPISSKLVAFNTFSFIVVRILHVSVFLWVQQYLLHRISPEEYGVYQVIGSLFFLMPILNNIFTSSSSRYVVKYFAIGELDKAREVIFNIFWVLLFVAILLIIVTTVLSIYIGSIFVIPVKYVSDAQIMLWLFSIVMVFFLILGPFSLGFHVKQKFALNNSITLITEIFRILVLFWLLLFVSTRALWVVVAFAVSEFIRIIIRIVISQRLVPELKFSLRAINTAIIPKLLSFGVWNTVITLSRYIRNHVALLVINRFAGAGNINQMSIDVTCFSIGRTMNQQILQLWEPVRASLGPALIAMDATGQEDRLRRSYCMGGRYALWLVMAVIVPLIIFREEFITLYASETYLKAATVIFLMLLPIPFQMVNVMLPQIAQAKARLKQLALRTLAVQLCSLIGVFISITKFNGGSLEAAGCFAIFNIAGEVLLIWPHGCELLKISPTKIFKSVISPNLIPFITATFVHLYISSNVQVTTWFSMFLSVIPGSMVYLIAIAFTLPNEDKNRIFSIIEKYRK